MKKIIVLQATLFILFSSVTLSWGQQIVSEEAKRYFDRGMAAVEMAKSPADLEEAIREFQKAAELAPGWPDPYYNLGLIQEKTGRLGDALRNLRKYLELSPNSADSGDVKQLINKIEYKQEKAEESQNIIKKLTAPGKWIKISGEMRSSAVDFRLRDGKLEGYVNRGYRGYPGEETWVWIPVSFDGEKLVYNFVYYHCAFTLHDGCPHRVFVKAEIVSTVPLRLKNKAVWSQQYGSRYMSEYEFLLEKVDNR